MIRRSILASSVGLSLAFAAPTAALAQDETVEASDEEVDFSAGEEGGEDAAAFIAMMLGMFFSSDPLTEEQTARLPMAEKVAGQLMPDGVLTEATNGLIDGLLEPLLQFAPSPAGETLSDGTGISDDDLNLTEFEKNDLARLFDPEFEERNKRMEAMLPELIGTVASSMEPGMRDAMAQVYAVNFDDAELAELNAFFSTATGAKFASKSVPMSADPRMIAGMIQSFPEVLVAVAAMQERVEEATADLPEVRTFADLSDAEKSRVAEATGYSVEEIETRLEEPDWDKLFGETEGSAEEADEEAEWVEEEAVEAAE